MRERCRNSKKQKEKIEMYVSHKKWQILKKNKKKNSLCKR